MPVYLQGALVRDIRFIEFGFNQSNSSNMVGKFNKETLYCISNFYLCETCVYLGLNISPPDGTRLTFSPGSTAKLQWTYNGSIYCRHVRRRWWSFTSSDGGQRERLATIYDDHEPRMYNSSLPEVAVEKPATLILKNADLRYNGTYQFYHLSRCFSKAKILVFIAGKC